MLQGNNCILYCSGRVPHNGRSSVLRVSLSNLGSTCWVMKGVILYVVVDIIDFKSVSCLKVVLCCELVPVE
jgi:hypothetical protein